VLAPVAESCLAKDSAFPSEPLLHRQVRRLGCAN